MILLSKFRTLFSGKDEKAGTAEIATVEMKPSAYSQTEEKEVDLTLSVSPEEKEIVAAIASAIFADNHSDVTFQVKNIARIDTDKEMVAAIVSAIAAGDNPASHFRLKSIARVE